MKSNIKKLIPSIFQNRLDQIHDPKNIRKLDTLTCADIIHAGLRPYEAMLEFYGKKSANILFIIGALPGDELEYYAVHIGHKLFDTLQSLLVRTLTEHIIESIKQP